MATDRRAPALGQAHQRGTTAVVMSRSDSAGLPPPVVPSEIGTASTRQGTRVWPTVLVWILLGAAIGAPWALLLFGDSLRPGR